MFLWHFVFYYHMFVQVSASWNLNHFWIDQLFLHIAINGRILPSNQRLKGTRFSASVSVPSNVLIAKDNHDQDDHPSDWNYSYSGKEQKSSRHSTLQRVKRQLPDINYDHLKTTLSTLAFIGAFVGDIGYETLGYSRPSDLLIAFGSRVQ